MNILGISAFYHDSAACLIREGEIISAVQEERFTRKKHDNSFPSNAILFCLENSKLKPHEIDYIVFYEKPFLKFERLLETYLAFAPKGLKSFSASLPIWIKDKLFQKININEEFKKIWGSEFDWTEKLLFSEHHLSHAASAFYPSPFKESAILTMDGVGEWTTTSIGIGKDNKISLIKEIQFPHSIGLLYSAFTYYLGFKVNSGEYKLMGLAPYGTPKYIDLIKKNLIDIKEDGSFHLDMSFFDYATGLKMTNQKFHNLFEKNPRNPSEDLTQFHMDVAASIQEVIEDIVFKLSKNIAKETKMKNLCLAGGVALNCVSNGKLLKEKIFENIWIQPAAGDSGGALGAALCVNNIMLNRPRLKIQSKDSMKGCYLGPKYDQKYIEKSLKNVGAVFDVFDEQNMLEYTAEQIANGKAVGWHQGRMEFGPRALGGRSILADPRSPNMQKLLNLKVKYRESFRPFAPSILREELSNWFDLENDSPYMLFVGDVKKDKIIKLSDKEKSANGIDRLKVVRSKIPAVTHVDLSARVQTVTEEYNARFYRLIRHYKKITGCPILVNTSFNVRGEPIVSTPEDAFFCFMGTELDLLVVGNCVLEKKKQDFNLSKSYFRKFKLD